MYFKPVLDFISLKIQFYNCYMFTCIFIFILPSQMSSFRACFSVCLWKYTFGIHFEPPLYKCLWHKNQWSPFKSHQCHGPQPLMNILWTLRLLDLLCFTNMLSFVYMYWCDSLNPSKYKTLVHFYLFLVVHSPVIKYFGALKCNFEHKKYFEFIYTSFDLKCTLH